MRWQLVGGTIHHARLMTMRRAGKNTLQMAYATGDQELAWCGNHNRLNHRR